MYYESFTDFPICNHSVSINQNNIGYTQGILDGGIPFEAELWNNANGQSPSVVMPEIFIVEQMDNISDEYRKVVTYRNQAESMHEGVLTIGMVDCGVIDDFDLTIKYVDFLEEKGLIEFVAEMRNGTVFLNTDIEGHDLVNVTITLKEDGNFFATTPLQFRNFPNQSRKNRFTIL